MRHCAGAAQRGCHVYLLGFPVSHVDRATAAEETKEGGTAAAAAPAVPAAAVPDSECHEAEAEAGTGAMGGGTTCGET